MIGVVADAGEHDVVRELFELFKTPWELARPGRRYDVLLTDGTPDVAGVSARLVLVYAGRPRPGDREPAAVPAPATLALDGERLPIGGPCVTFAGDAVVPLVDTRSRRAAAQATASADAVLVRVGYALFAEVRRLLTDGQPVADAGIPTLDRHVDLLRRLVVRHAAPLVEIPPVPAGHAFIACLTHDLDHPSIRRHGWDRTTAGFVYRALVGSLVDVVQRRRPMRTLLTNWAAAARLPLVHVGLADDFWLGFDRYLALERGRGSTFFVIPFAGAPGATTGGRAPAARAARYGASDIAGRLRALVAAGAEVGVHGIDAWHDSARGQEELRAVSDVTGTTGTGVRMHWLYGDATSAAALEKAGFEYDSTCGYNETVGFRAGTTQAFKPLDAIRLLELPLHVMDTALFYPRYLGLGSDEAWSRVREIAEHARVLGGAITINWHDRSLAPERLWGDVYGRLLDHLAVVGAWCPTAGRAVAWFRKRRAASFECVGAASVPLRAKVPVAAEDRLPRLRLRIHRRGEPSVDIALPDGCTTTSPV
jgi:hypothetical protein